MSFYYTAEKQTRMLLALMKAHGVKKIVVSPGTTNICLVGSAQHDPYFELYSSVDERSAAYMACGLAGESGEPVALSCTGATASRNYVPGLTEAYYRKLPVLAITSTQHTGRVGQLQAQVIDRSVIQNDIAVKSVQLPFISSEEDEWECDIKINDALLSLTHKGGGPVHINLPTEYSRDFGVKTLEKFRVIRRITLGNNLPSIQGKRVAIFLGAHKVWSDELTLAVDTFCEKYDSVVLQDHTGNYHGKCGVDYCIVATQQHKYKSKEMDLLIDLGDVSGTYMDLRPTEVWRVNPDGEIRDRWRKLTYVFDMEEHDFFDLYNNQQVKKQSNPIADVTTYYEECKREHDDLTGMIPELPFSNAWVASVTAGRIPEGSVLYLGILNTLRCWDFFDVSATIDCYSNTGGFGIDGMMSTFIGGALAAPDRLHFLVIGDLSFFYDMNSIANHYVPDNIRILLVNNGGGIEFKNYNHFAAQFGDEANEYMAAMGHFGNKSPELVKHYASDLGFEYHSASNKEKYNEVADRFLTPENTGKPMLLEIFTDYQDESDAIKRLNTLIEDPPTATDMAKHIIKGVIGADKASKLKRLIKG